MPALTTRPGVVFPCSCSDGLKSGSKYPTSLTLNMLLYGLHANVGGGGRANDGAGGQFSMKVGLVRRSIVVVD